MACTNINNENERIMKKNQISTFAEKYYMDRPGWGASIPFVEDPHMRLEKWGANTRNNLWDIEYDLKGMTRNLNRDYVNTNDFRKNTPKVDVSPVSQPQLSMSFADESRASHPPSLYRQIEMSRWEIPLLNPQNYQILEFPLLVQKQTRILQKDGITNLSNTRGCSMESQQWIPFVQTPRDHQSLEIPRNEM